MIIRPLSDLRNHFADIAKTVQESEQPVFLTKNGHGSMVVMSIEAYQKMKFDAEVYCKLVDAERAMQRTSARLSHEEVFASARQAIGEEGRV